VVGQEPPDNTGRLVEGSGANHRRTMMPGNAEP